MILVDTSVWVDHLRAADPALQRLLEASLVLGHPWVIGEIALGHLSRRTEVLRLLAALPAAAQPTAGEAAVFLERHRLMGRGIGYVDLHLLAATALTVDARLWSRDRRLATCAAELDLAVDATFEIS